MQVQQPKIGPYQIISELGIGGMAVVYRALDTQNNREIALKILLPQFVDDQTFLQRFLREGQNTKRLHHPHIVRTFDAGVIDGHYYIAMELIEGANLAEYVDSRGTLLEFRETIDILSQVAAALDYAHSLGFLHRDIKLTNILISNDGRALLSDFGAAKHLSADYTMLTTTGQSIGTPSYMSPEQARAEVNLDFRTDVYSLGVVAFKLFTGRMPYAADSQPELLYKIVYDDVPDPQIFNEEISLLLANVLKRVLSKQPQARYESGGGFVGAIVASKRWRLNLAEDLSKSTQVVQDTVPKKSAWRGISLALGALATVIIVLALSSTVRTQENMIPETSNLSEAAVEEVVTEVMDDVASSLPSLDLKEIALLTETVRIPIEGVGNIGVQDLTISNEELNGYLDFIPGSAEFSGFGRSLLSLVPFWEPQPAGENAEASSSNGLSSHPSTLQNDTLSFDESAPKPPLVPILPQLPAPKN